MCQGRTEDVSVDVPETSTERPADVPAPQSRGRPVPGLGTSCGRTVDVSGTSTSQGCPRDVSQGSETAAAKYWGGACFGKAHQKEQGWHYAAMLTSAAC